MPFIEVKTNKNLSSLEIENIEKEVEKHIVLLKKSKEWLMVNVIPSSRGISFTEVMYGCSCTLSPSPWPVL